MKTRSPEAVAKSATRWIVAAVILVLYLGIVSLWRTNINGNVYYAMQQFSTPTGNHYSTQEIYRTAWNYTDDYWLAPDKWEERLESDAMWYADAERQQGMIDDLRRSIDKLKAEMGESS